MMNPVQRTQNQPSIDGTPYNDVTGVRHIAARHPNSTGWVRAFYASVIAVGFSTQLFGGTSGAGPIVLVYTTRTSIGSNSAQPGDLAEQPVHLEVSRSHHRLTVYKGLLPIHRYPVAVGREGWETPLGVFRVSQMIEDPDWQHPLTGQVFRAGDQRNELGHYWIGFWTDGQTCVGFHGTPHPQTVGKSASHGCIRMYEKDVEELFSQVAVGTPVSVVR